MKKIIIHILVLTSLSFLYAEKKGSSAYEFLFLEPDAASSGMASCVSPIINNAYASYWNPAGLAMMEQKRNISYSHAFLFADIQYDNIAAAWDLSQYGTLGLFAGALYLASAIEALDLDGNPLEGNFTSGFSTVSLSYAKRVFGGKGFGARFYLGANIKMISETLHTYKRTDFALDFGFIGDSIFLEDVSFSLVMKNIGTSRNIIPDISKENMPFNFTVGLSTKKVMYDRSRNEIMITPVLEVHGANDFLTVIRGGLEARYSDFHHDYKTFLRVGYETSDDIPGITGFRFGLGGQFKNIKADYALSPFNPTGMTHRMSMEYSF